MEFWPPRSDGQIPHLADSKVISYAYDSRRIMNVEKILYGFAFRDMVSNVCISICKGGVLHECVRRRPVGSVWVHCFSQFGKMCAIGMRGMSACVGLVEIFVDKMAVAEL